MCIMCYISIRVHAYFCTYVIMAILTFIIDIKREIIKGDKFITKLHIQIYLFQFALSLNYC